MINSEEDRKIFPPRGIEWLWWVVLLVSLIVGFGMTWFAPL